MGPPRLKLLLTSSYLALPTAWPQASQLPGIIEPFNLFLGNNKDLPISHHICIAKCPHLWLSQQRYPSKTKKPRPSLPRNDSSLSLQVLVQTHSTFPAQASKVLQSCYWRSFMPFVPLRDRELVFNRLPRGLGSWVNSITMFLANIRYSNCSNFPGKP